MNTWPYKSLLIASIRGGLEGGDKCDGMINTRRISAGFDEDLLGIPSMNSCVLYKIQLSYLSTILEGDHQLSQARKHHLVQRKQMQFDSIRLWFHLYNI